MIDYTEDIDVILNIPLEKVIYASKSECFDELTKYINNLTDAIEQLKEQFAIESKYKCNTVRLNFNNVRHPIYKLDVNVKTSTHACIRKETKKEQTEETTTDEPTQDHQ